MTRAEQRRLERELKKSNRTYTLNSDQIEDIKQEAVDEALDKAFKLMLCIPVMAIHDNYSKIMKKEVDGKNREERFANIILDIYDSYKRGYVTLDDLEKCLYEETGIKFDKEGK